MSKHKDRHGGRPEEGGGQGPEMEREEAGAEGSGPQGAPEGQPSPSVQKPGAAEAGENGQSPEERIAALEAQLAEARDQYLRKAADFENFRKRMNQEKQNAIEFANQSLLLDLIPVIDDLERALKAAQGALEGGGEGSAGGASGEAGGTNSGFKTLCAGISMIEKRLVSLLENKWGLQRFDSEGEPFDPNRHEAIMMEKSPDITEPVVKEDFVKGYMLKDRVVRPAKVKVIMPEGQ